MPTGFLCCQCISTAEVGIIERLGEFNTLARPGLSFIAWPLDSLVATISTRVQQLDVTIETKTKDNVFCTVVVSVQYMALLDRVFDAYYRLQNPVQQIRSYVFDVVRSTLPKMELDAAFEAKEDIAVAVKSQLSEVMVSYGFEIMQALVTDLEPDRRVKDSMNEINASKRLREAASYKAEADKASKPSNAYVMQVKAAEAEAESKYLSGVGVARQRKAIVDGLRDSISDFSDKIEGTTSQDVMHLLLLTQYFDMLRDMGSTSKSNTVFVPHGPGAVNQLQDSLRDGFLHAAAANN
ncbi:unnamed protein product [Chrysoparadoxa australica]